MIDIGTGLTVLGGAIGSTELILKVLGPTAEYLGEGLQNWTQKRVTQTQRIFENADRHLGDNPPGGRVPPRVLRDVLNDGAFRDDTLSAAYYGGILASSRSGVSRDDRGASFSGMVSRLTTYQLRAHFIFYTTFARLFKGHDINLLEATERSKTVIFIPMEDYFNAMAYEVGEDNEALLSHVVHGLDREALIDYGVEYADEPYSWQSYPNIPENLCGICIPPSALGVELFLWSNGYASSNVNEILSAELDLSNIDVANCPNAFRAIEGP